MAPWRHYRFLMTKSNNFPVHNYSCFFQCNNIPSNNFYLFFITFFTTKVRLPGFAVTAIDCWRPQKSFYVRITRAGCPEKHRMKLKKFDISFLRDKDALKCTQCRGTNIGQFWSRLQQRSVLYCNRSKKSKTTPIFLSSFQFPTGIKSDHDFPPRPWTVAPQIATSLYRCVYSSVYTGGGDISHITKLRSTDSHRNERINFNIAWQASQLRRIHTG